MVTLFYIYIIVRKRHCSLCACLLICRSSHTVSHLAYPLWQIDVVIEFAREVALSVLLYADDLVLASETIEGLWNKFLKWKEAFVSKGLKVNLGETKVIICGGITKDGMSRSKVVPCGVGSLRVTANLVLCLHCGKWMDSRCA